MSAQTYCTGHTQTSIMCSSSWSICAWCVLGNGKWSNAVLLNSLRSRSSIAVCNPSIHTVLYTPHTVSMNTETQTLVSTRHSASCAYHYRGEQWPAGISSTRLTSIPCLYTKHSPVGQLQISLCLQCIYWVILVQGQDPPQTLSLLDGKTAFLSSPANHKAYV